MNYKYEVYPVKTFFHKWVNYSYIVFDKATKYAMIVDPAWELEKIVNVVKVLEANITAIFLTHAHYDHVNLVDPLVSKYHATVYMSEKESEYYKYNCKNLKMLKDKEIIKIGDTYIKCILTPGHTLGGMCYLLQDSMFTGDTIFSEGCGICCEDGGSAEQMFYSIQKIKLEIGRHVKVYPGHSYGKEVGQTVAQLMQDNIYFQIHSKETFIHFRMRGNQKNIFTFK